MSDFDYKYSWPLDGTGPDFPPPPPLPIPMSEFPHVEPWGFDFFVVPVDVTTDVTTEQPPEETSDART